jgi:hypothetical protein
MDVTDEEIQKAVRRSKRAAFDYVIHCLTGTGCLLAVFAPICGMHFAIEWLHTTEIGWYFILLLTIAEYALATADTGLFLVFLCRSVMRTYRCL